LPLKSVSETNISQVREKGRRKAVIDRKAICMKTSMAHTDDEAKHPLSARHFAIRHVERFLSARLRSEHVVNGLVGQQTRVHQLKRKIVVRFPTSN
jgi:hypothetical protein